MKRVCAWCKKDLGEVPSGVAEERDITHGICNECLSNIEFQAGADLSRFLDSLPAPVLVLDKQSRVQMLNRAASDLPGIDHAVHPGTTPGLVFECRHARDPGGCSRAIHCSGCAIRMAIQETAATGRGVVRQPATLTQEDQEVRLLITTEKVGGLILLRIDEQTGSQPGGAA